MASGWPDRWLQSALHDCVIADRVRLCDFHDTRATLSWASANRPKEILRERYQLDPAWPPGRRRRDRLPDGRWARFRVRDGFPPDSWRGVMRAAQLMESDADDGVRSWRTWERFYCVPVYLDTYALGTLCLEVNSSAFRAMLNESSAQVSSSAEDEGEAKRDNFDGLHAIAAAAAYIRLWHEGRRRRELSRAVVDALVRHSPIRRRADIGAPEAEHRAAAEELTAVRERFLIDVLAPQQVYDLACLLGICSARSSIVQIVDVTPRVIELLRRNPAELYELSPSAFEMLIANRLDAMGYDVISTGAVFTRDGGIDLIATPKTRHVGSFLLAAQVKHHRVARPTTRSDVDRLLAWKDSAFRLGLIVTNTWFTSDARWIAQKDHNAAFLRLREFTDVKRWLFDNFADADECRELPRRIELAPGIAVDVPRLRLPEP